MCKWDTNKTLSWRLHRGVSTASPDVSMSVNEKSSVCLQQPVNPSLLTAPSPVVFSHGSPCVCRLTTDQPVMSLLPPSQCFNLRHLVILGARPRQLRIKPTLRAPAWDSLTDKHWAAHAKVNWMNCWARFHVLKHQTHLHYDQIFYLRTLKSPVVSLEMEGNF